MHMHMHMHVHVMYGSLYLVDKYMNVLTVVCVLSFINHKPPKGPVKNHQSHFKINRQQIGGAESVAPEVSASAVLHGQLRGDAPRLSPGCPGQWNGCQALRVTSSTTKGEPLPAQQVKLHAWFASKWCENTSVS